MAQILIFSRLRSGDNLLPAHAIHLVLNNSSFCTRHEDEIIYDFMYIIMDCPLFANLRCQYFHFLCDNNFSTINPLIILFNII